MGIKFSNNAVTTLASGISNVATSMTVAAGYGDAFPALGAGDYFYCTLVASPTSREIVKVTARSGDVMTIVRAQDGTGALTLSAGAVVEQRLNAGALTDPSTVTSALGFTPYNPSAPNAGLKEARVAMAANDIDLSLGNFFTKTISTGVTLTVSNVPASGTAVSFVLDLTNGGAAAITWWSGVKWAGGIAPILTTSGRDVLGFFTHDAGTTWTGLVLGKDVR